MKTIRLFIDFGSTFTKVCAFDMAAEALAGWAKAPSTVETDITEGLENALDLLSAQVSITDQMVAEACASSSAAGGLRIACIGLTPELTTKAAQIAAFGAGAKVAGIYSYRLSEADISELEKTAPDIIILSGGTDGGDKKAIAANAEMLAAAGSSVNNIIVAGNKSAYDIVSDIFSDSGKNVSFTKNVLPSFDKLELTHINEQVRDTFIKRITVSKGIDKACSMINKVIMPTPSAVLEAAKLLSDGIRKGEPGIGELMIVDVGGATTDVYSVADGLPSEGGRLITGLKEPRVKRTVEGDLGLYHNLDCLSDAAEASDDPGISENAALLHNSFGIPSSAQLQSTHVLLARTAVRIAVERHCGKLSPMYTGNGIVQVQSGKDLTKIPALIGAGGPLVFSSDIRTVLEGALRSCSDESMLKPEAPEIYADYDYILFAAGLLSQDSPETALHILKKYIRKCC